MSRITAPVSKLSRALSSSASTAQRGALFDSPAHTAGVALMPKYAELLHGRKGHEHADSSRGLATTHRPTPQPSIANRSKPLMQTFHSSAPVAHTSSAHLDAMVIPNPWEMDNDPTPDPGPPMPLLPDNYGAAHVASETPEPRGGPTIVAADPEKVMPSTPMSEVDTVGLDGVELKFMYQGEPPAQAEQEQGSSGMIRDIWKGMVDDVFGQPGKKA